MTRLGDPRRLPVLWVPKTPQALLVVFVAGMFFVPRVGVAADAGDGRRHAQRASHLAASGKCRQAIPEFDKAIAVLHDPTLLFNRGECHRKLGNAEAALEDYNQFLTELPQAPNRAQVEARIAELRQAGSAGAPPPSAGVAAPSADVRAPATKPGPASAPALARPAVEAAPTGLAEVTPPAPASPPEGPLLSAPAPAPRSEAAASRGDALTSGPWFWVALGAVVVGAGVGAYFVLGRDPTNVPRSDLGNYRF